MSTEEIAPPQARAKLGLPRRFLRMVLIGLLIATTLWIGLLAAGEYARSASQQRIIAAGLPVNLSQALPPIHSPHNGAHAYTRAFIAMSSQTKPHEVFRPDSPSSVDPLWTADDWEEWDDTDWQDFAQRLKSANGQKITQALDEATQAQYCLFERAFKGPGTLLPEITFQMALARNCEAATSWFMLNNDEGKTIQWLLRWQRLAHHAISHQPFLINLLVGTRIEVMLHEFIAENEDQLGRPIRDALVPGFANPADLRQSYVTALHGERIEFLDALLDGPHSTQLAAINDEGTWFASSLLYRPFRAFEHAALRDNHLQRVTLIQTTSTWDFPPEDPRGPISYLLMAAYSSVEEALQKLDISRLKTNELLSNDSNS